jgi:hypothetical protein
VIATTLAHVAADARLRRDRLVVVAGSVVTILSVVPLLVAYSLTDWPFAFAIAGTGSAVLLASALFRRDTLLLHIWVFALVFGLAELAVDAWLVGVTSTLDYRPYAVRGGPMWWASPLFMPFAWQVLVAHIAVLTEAASDWGRGRQLAVALAVGAAYVPVGEELSIRAGFWLYRDVPMLSHVPIYIVIGETLLAVSVALLLPALARRRWSFTMAAGLVSCAALWAGYAIGIAVL